MSCLHRSVLTTSHRSYAQTSDSYTFLWKYPHRQVSSHRWLSFRIFNGNIQMPDASRPIPYSCTSTASVGYTPLWCFKLYEINNYIDRMTGHHSGRTKAVGKTPKSNIIQILVYLDFKKILIEITVGFSTYISLPKWVNGIAFITKFSQPPWTCACAVISRILYAYRAVSQGAGLLPLLSVWVALFVWQIQDIFSV